MIWQYVDFVGAVFVLWNLTQSHTIQRKNTFISHHAIKKLSQRLNFLLTLFLSVKIPASCCDFKLIRQNSRSTSSVEAVSGTELPVYATDRSDQLQTTDSTQWLSHVMLCQQIKREPNWIRTENVYTHREQYAHTLCGLYYSVNIVHRVKYTTYLFVHWTSVKLN